MAKLGRQYALGTDEGNSGLIATLLPGRWSGTRHAILAKESKVPSTGNFAKTELATGFDFHEARVAGVNGDDRLDIVNEPFVWETPRIDVWLNESLPNRNAKPKD